MIRDCHNGADKWILSSSGGLDFRRTAWDFPPFPDMLTDSAQQLNTWLKITQITPLRAHEHRCSRHWRVAERTISDCAWFFITNGRGYFWMENKSQRYRFSPGDMIFISQGVPHAIYSEQKTTMRQIAVHFHAKLFGTINLFDLLGFPCYVPARPDSPFETVSAALARDYALKAPGWECFMSGNIMNVLLFVMRHYGHLFKPLQVRNLNHIPPRLVEILTGLDRQLHNPGLTIPKLAEQAGCSHAYLRKLINGVTGLSPVAFLQRRRIEIACRYLRCTQMSIKEIVAQTGFGDPAYFYRTFKRWTNTTPVLYRKDYKPV